MEEPTIPIPNVMVVRQSEFGWFCEHEGRPMFIGTSQIAPRTPRPVVGACSTIEVYAFALRDLYPDGPPEPREPQPNHEACHMTYCDGSYRR